MKEFYVMNLDMRRIAIIAGAALTALGLTLFIGMAIGRGQGEKNARIAAEETQQAKLGLTASESADKLVMAAGPNVGDAEAAALGPKRKPHTVEKFAALEKTVIPSVPEAAPEIPLREDPLVSGPPKRTASAKKSHKVARARDADDAAERPRKKKAVAPSRKTQHEEPEVSGRVEHAKARRKKRASDEDDQLAPVAGTSSAQRAASARYTIQVAAFKRSSEANNLIAKLKEEGLKAHSERHGDYYLVTVGRSNSKTRLEKALARLKELEYDAYIRKLSAPSNET